MKYLMTILVLVFSHLVLASGNYEESEEPVQCPEVCQEQCVEEDDDGNCLQTEEICSQPQSC